MAGAFPFGADGVPFIAAPSEGKRQFSNRKYAKIARYAAPRSLLLGNVAWIKRRGG
jgi:hypothetical protein